MTHRRTTVTSPQFLTSASVLIVAGKGGVGKTTVAAALAVAASAAGLRVLIVDVEGRASMPAAFGTDPLTYEERALVDTASDHAGVYARTVTPDDALLDYLNERGLQRLSRRLVSTGLLDVIATAIPGIKDILVLGKVKQIERSGLFDLVLVDAPAAGHAITFLRSASGLLDAVGGGPINAQAQEVQTLLTDSDRCRVLLVTIPEETPVNELIETAYNLEDRVGVALGPVIINGVHPDLPGLHDDPETAADQAGVALVAGEAEALRSAAEFRLARTAVQREQLDRLANELPLPQLRLPDLFTSTLGRAEVDILATALSEQFIADDARGRR